MEEIRKWGYAKVVAIGPFLNMVGQVIHIHGNDYLVKIEWAFPSDKRIGHCQVEFHRDDLVPSTNKEYREGLRSRIAERNA